MSNNNKKTKGHAKEYLLEYKDKKGISNWLVLLIQKTIDLNGKISETDKEQIFNELIIEHKLNSNEKNDTLMSESLNLQTEIDQEVDQKLIIKKILHKKGVNALIPNQSITFSDTCTIIYGLNGSGKSGYFRIINELSGGVKVKKILDNIYKHGDGLEVDVDFLLDGTIQHTYEWRDKSLRSINPFDKIKVFDSEYLPIFLNKRESSVNIEPLGLHLFQVITSMIDEFKDKLEELKQKKENQKPDLKFLIDILYSEEIKSLLKKNNLTEEENKLLENEKLFSDEDFINITELKEKKDNIEKDNIEDRKKVLQQEKLEIDNLKEHLNTLKKKFESFFRDCSEVISDFLLKKKERDSRLKEFEVLKDIPSQNTEEWLAFIQSAKNYGNNISQKVFNKDITCIYCHQLLGEQSLKLIQAYSQYLGDKSQQNFKSAIDKIEKLNKNVYYIQTNFLFSENLEKILTEIKVEKDVSYKVLIEKILEEFEQQKLKIIKSLEDKIILDTIFSLDLQKIDEKLVELSEERGKKIDDLAKSEFEKKELLINITNDINLLEDRKNISECKARIETYFSDCKIIQKYSTVIQQINTRGITELGAKAHDELLTDSIRQSFEKELKSLKKDIEVSLEKVSAGKGTVQTMLKILKNDVCSILSDGEQKAVGLALFLAEIEKQKNGCPIVFDDPVTSIDHEVANLLAQKLLKISSDRQIIIFTHNKLFYDSLVYWANNLKDDQNNKTYHVCKNYTQKGCNGKGHHVYTYKIDRESKEKIGRIFEAQNESCDYFIKKAENEIKSDYSVNCVASYLKLAIEYYIDEKILLKTGLMKDRLQGMNVPWESLKKLESKKDILEKLESFWHDLSNRGTHITRNSEEIPLTTEDLNNIINFLKS